MCGKFFPDLSSCEGISFVAKSTELYNGYRFVFASDLAPTAYKAHFDPPYDEFGTVRIPFKSFTNSTDAVTGDPIETCQESPKNCPDEKTLKNIKTLAFFAQGVEGKVHLEVEGISAYGCVPKVADNQLATFHQASDTSFSWHFTAIPFGVLVCLALYLRKSPTPIVRPLLG